MNVLPCKCGKPAELDVSISAAEPFDVLKKAHRTELHLSVIACRACAFEAAKLMLAHLEGKEKPS